MMYVRLPASSGWMTALELRPCVVPKSSPPKSSAPSSDADGGVAAEQGDSDAEEAHLAERDVERAELVVRYAEHVDRAGETREGAGDRHRADQVLLHVDAAVRRRVGVEADRLDLVPERRPVEERPEDDEGGERDEEADVDALEPLHRPRSRASGLPATTWPEIGTVGCVVF